MKKIFIYASICGLALGVLYWLYKKQKSNNTLSKPMDNNADLEHGHQKEDAYPNSSFVEDMYQAKSESAQAVYERHSEASEIMKDAYSNIMEDFVEAFSGEKDMNKEEKKKDVIIDGESVSVMKEIDLISDELDDLLK